MPYDSTQLNHVSLQSLQLTPCIWKLSIFTQSHSSDKPIEEVLVTQEAFQFLDNFSTHDTLSQASHDTLAAGSLLDVSVSVARAFIPWIDSIWVVAWHVHVLSGCCMVLVFPRVLCLAHAWEWNNGEMRMRENRMNCVWCMFYRGKHSERISCACNMLW